MKNTVKVNCPALHPLKKQSSAEAGTQTAPSAVHALNTRPTRLRSEEVLYFSDFVAYATLTQPKFFNLFEKTSESSHIVGPTIKF